MIQAIMFKEIYDDCKDFWKAYWKTLLWVIILGSIFYSLCFLLPYGATADIYIALIIGLSIYASIEVLIVSAVTYKTNPFVGMIAAAVVGSIFNAIGGAL